jgi:hypothetical protein
VQAVRGYRRRPEPRACGVSAKLAAHRTAALAVLSDYQQAMAGRGSWFDWPAWTLWLAAELGNVQAVLAAEPEPSKLAAIRGVLTYWDADATGAREALERIEQIAQGSRTASGPEAGSGAYLTEPDLRTVLDALDVAADYKRDRAACCPDCEASPADLCGTCEWRLHVADGYDDLARRIGGTQ